MSHISCVRDTKHATQTIWILELSFVHTGGSQHATPQLNRVCMSYYMQVYTTTEKFSHNQKLKKYMIVFEKLLIYDSVATEKQCTFINDNDK